MESFVIEAGDSDFHEKVLDASHNIPVIVDFWAPWCGPCKLLGPRLENLANSYEGKFILAKVDISKNQALSEKFDVRSIPFVKMFKAGALVDEFIGSLSEVMVKSWIEKNL